MTEGARKAAVVAAKEELEKPLRLDWVTAELEDESNEQGTVLVKNKDGAVVATMPRAVWDELRAYKKEAGK